MRIKIRDTAQMAQLSRYKHSFHSQVVTGKSGLKLVQVHYFSHRLHQGTKMSFLKVINQVIGKSMCECINRNTQEIIQILKLSGGGADIY